MVESIHRVTTQLRETAILAEGVRLLRLSDPTDWDLPPFTPGAHIDIHLPSGRLRQYSLCGDTTDRKNYYIAVQKEVAGRGGSKEVHWLEAGQELLVSLPRNLLPLIDAPKITMIAGGIGITPFIPMIFEMVRTNRQFSLHFASRHNEAPFAPQLQAFCPDKIALYPNGSQARLDISAIISGLTETEHLYCCGPARMIDEVLAKTEHMSERVHIEYFAAQSDPSQKAYEVHLSRSNRIIPVLEGQTMLEALRAAEVEIPSSCEAGICMKCKTRFLEGIPVHRDIAMPKTDRETHLTPCVSGCTGEKITLDL